jgi:ABC-2 type transport system ATP-binding protein
MKAVEIKNFTKKYGNNTAVDNISLDIKKGEFFGFLGPNGAGKTSTISCITGTSRFKEGSIKVFGLDVQKDYREARKEIGISAQEFNVDIFGKVKNILWFSGGFFGMSKADRKKRIDEVIKIFELEDHQEKAFRALSGGLKRRVMLARAMMHDPELLILDEPTAGVDVELRHELWKYLKRINKEGKTILFTSHYLEEVEYLCDRIAIINNGKIVAMGDKSEFTKNGNTLEKTYLEITKKEK